ncbi:MAG: hypothetical protein M3Q27_10250 [Actinomycetota bacterium]|nr:hypothetical protein [Actinomycetota bacterium]
MPAVLTGALTAPAGRRPASVVIAVNGVIAAVSPVFPDRGSAFTFGTMADERLFGDGANTVELFELADAASRQVRRIELAQQ